MSRPRNAIANASRSERRWINLAGWFRTSIARSASKRSRSSSILRTGSTKRSFTIARSAAIRLRCTRRGASPRRISLSRPQNRPVSSDCLASFAHVDSDVRQNFLNKSLLASFVALASLGVTQFASPAKAELACPTAYGVNRQIRPIGPPSTDVGAIEGFNPEAMLAPLGKDSDAMTIAAVQYLSGDKLNGELYGLGYREEDGSIQVALVDVFRALATRIARQAPGWNFEADQIGSDIYFYGTEHFVMIGADGRISKGIVHEGLGIMQVTRVLREPGPPKAPSERPNRLLRFLFSP